MTFATSIAFILTCGFVCLILIRLAKRLYAAIVLQEDRRDYGRDYWDEEELEPGVTVTLLDMGTKLTPIEIWNRESLYEQDT